MQYDNTVRDADGSVVEVRSASVPLPALRSLSLFVDITIRFAYVLTWLRSSCTARTRWTSRG